jgi:DNA polymerase IV
LEVYRAKAKVESNGSFVKENYFAPCHNEDVRKIIHIDLDAFYASVEERDNPDLKGKPMAVAWSGPRGVVLTANYAARVYKVHSALPVSLALKRLPDLLLIPPRMDVYKEVSRTIHEVFHQYTDIIEPLSLDEAYLDVSDVEGDLGTATTLAKNLKRDILEATQLTASAGVSFNKFLAKLASGMNKPDSLTVITQDEAQGLIDALPVEDFYGVGPKTAAKLKTLGIHTGADLKGRSLEDLKQTFGKVGEGFYSLARTQDERPVESNRETKSISNETTFEEDTNDKVFLGKELRPLSEQVAQRLAKAKLEGKTVVLKIKYANFKSITRQTTLEQPLHEAADIEVSARTILGDLELERKVRLLGVGVSNLSERGVTKKPKKAPMFE